MLNRIGIIEDTLTCTTGSSLSVCDCPPGMTQVPHINNGECVSFNEYSCPIPEQYTNWRLPTTVDGRPVALPSHYDVDLDLPGLYEEDKINGNFYFNGTSSVDFVVNEEICSFHLHIKGEYEIHSVQVNIGGVDVQVSHMINAEYQYLSIFSEYKIPINSQIRATVQFRVQVPTGTSGLYLAHYTNDENQVRYLLATQFESTSARAAFPCFDEPLLKATFQFSMKYKYEEYSAIFNTEIINTVIDGDWKTNTYDKTMKMPTYLLAILVSDYTLENFGVSAKGARIRILGRKGWEEQSEFALQETITEIDNFSDKWAYDYCIPFGEDPLKCKSDQAGIPQFGAGAMENWGLITYREYYLFIDEQRDTFYQKRSATRIIGHELMHMWFGNVVSCPWWDEIYINEAFGSIGGYLGMLFSESTNDINYQWEDEYLYSQTYSGLNTDGLITSRPMVNNANNGDLKVETPTEISRQFDNIAYNKAGSIMLMIRAIMGDELWTAGLRNYLRGQEFGSATWDQLLSYFDGAVEAGSSLEASLEGMTITDILEPYFRQMGYPVLKVQLTTNSLTIRTHRYLQEGTNNQLPISEFGYKWRVPLFLHENGNERIHWLEDAGENDNNVYTVDIQPGAVVNPNGNIWARINFDSAYIHEAINQHWSGTMLLARNIAKMFQDHYRMLISSNVAEFDVSLKTLMDMTWFLRGPNVADLDGDKTRWLIWREVDTATIFGTLHNRVGSYLRNEDVDSPEGQLYEAYRSYMYSKVDYFIDEVYPDRYPLDNDPLTPHYDNSEVRLTENALSMAMRYGDETSTIFKSANDLAMFTVTRDWTFREHSPDTRKTTFKAAVTYESHEANRPVIDYLLQEISEAVTTGTELPENIRACTNKDVTTVIVPLYTGDCMLNAYFVALASVQNIDTAMLIKEALPIELQADYLINLASNPTLNRAITSTYQNTAVEEIESEFTPDQLSNFIRNGCNHFSTVADQAETAKWSTLVFSIGHRLLVDTALVSCEATWTVNSGFMDTHYGHLREWICENGLLECNDLSFDLYPFGFISDTHAVPFNEWYLPRDIATGEAIYQPSNYEVFLDYDGLKEADKTDGFFHYRGESTVHFINTAELTTINLHVDTEEWMTVLESTVVADGVNIPVLHMHHNSDYLIVTIYLGKNIRANANIQCWTKYEVKLSDVDTQGLYVSYFTNDSGVKEYLLATQFESTHAREAFPCFDEPSLKATFDFKMKYRYRDEFTAIYNTDVKSFEDVDTDARINTYYRSAKMPTYLNAVLVSTFHVESKGVSPSDVTVRILGRDDWKDETEFCLGEALTIVDAMSEYFDYDYCEPLLNADTDGSLAENPLKCKSDQAGIPTFRSGAMENWGLITYREYYLHYDERRDNFLVRRTCTSIVGHELIHMWFGNLVTCPWWDEIYINEAFGSIGGYLGMHLAGSHAEVDYAWEDEYLVSQTFSGMDGDARLTSRPMVNNANNGDLKVETPSEIRSQFDGIAYNKAGSVMLMVRAVIGETLWQKGLRAYLKGQEFSTSTGDRLLTYWDAAALESDIDNLLDGYSTVSAIFEPYFKQMGYPMLYIRKISETQYEIRTERYLDRDGDRSMPVSEFNYQWHVPLVIKTETNKYIEWLENAGNTEEVYTVTVPEGAIIDPDANIYIRIRYENYIPDIITAHWDSNTNSLLNRHIAKIMRDTTSLMRSSRTDHMAVAKYTDLMEMTWLIRGKGDDDVNSHYSRWIVYQELSSALSGGFTSNMVAALHDASGVADQALYSAFKSYFASKLDNTIYPYDRTIITDPTKQGVYPDKQPLDWDTADIGDLEAKKARMSPYIASLALKYMPTDSDYFYWASDLANLTASGDWDFLDHSPDTREYTFQAAVACESDGSCTTVSTDFMITEIVNYGSDDFFCTSTDLRYPLYGGDCRLHRYWNALKASRNAIHAMNIKDRLPTSLQVRYIREVSSNIYLSKPLMNHFLAMTDAEILSHFDDDVTQLQSFITGACGRFSSTSDQAIIDQWTSRNLDVESAIESCNNTRESNRVSILEYFYDVKDWLCAEWVQDGCTSWTELDIDFSPM